MEGTKGRPLLEKRVEPQKRRSLRFSRLLSFRGRLPGALTVSNAGWLHVLPAPAVEDASILDFRKTEELITEGRALTDRYLRDFEQLES